MIFPHDTAEINELTPSHVSEPCIGRISPVTGITQTKSRDQISYKGQYWITSRLSYHLNVSPINRRPPDRKSEFVCHTCDNAWCIQYKHLYLGTQTQNMADRTNRKGTLLSNETKLKMSKAAKDRFKQPGAKDFLIGREFSNETRDKMSESAKARLVTPEERMANAKFTGHKHSNESREKMSIGVKTSWTPERKLKQKERLLIRWAAQKIKGGRLSNE